jgi:diaminopropionate ammonia-lyase
VTRDLFSNPAAAGSAGKLPPPSRQPLAFHRRLPAYSPTPLVDATRLAQRLGLRRLWVKDESTRLGLPSFKLLGASWAVYRALSCRLGENLEPWGGLEDLRAKLVPHGPLALAAATDGNHGRAVAHMARLLGLEARIFVPSGTSPARVAAIQSEGASCTVVVGSYDQAVARSAKEESERCLVISDTSWPGYETVPAWVIEGYSTIYWEVDEALEALGEPGPDLVVVPIGVGALAAACARHYRRAGLERRPALLGVEPLAAACVLASMRAGRIVSVPGPHDSIMVGLNCGTPSLIAWPDMAAIDLFVAVEDERARQAMRELAGAGIVAGETGASALAGLDEALTGPDSATWRQRLGLTPEASALVICTEGATDEASYRSIVGRDPGQVRPQGGDRRPVGATGNGPPGKGPR